MKILISVILKILVDNIVLDEYQKIEIQHSLFAMKIEQIVYELVQQIYINEITHMK